MDSTEPRNPSVEREAVVASTFIELVERAADSDEVELLSFVAESCVRILDGDAAGVSLAVDGRLGFVVATSESMEIIELVQADHQEGPCVDAFRSGRPTRVSDLENEVDRWPTWAPRALELGFRAAETFPMTHQQHTIGVIDLYATRRRTLNDADLILGKLVAEMATLAVNRLRTTADLRTLNEQLRRALESRIIIEQAKGVLSERHRMSPQGAFELLRSHSRRHNTRLPDVAHRVVHDDLDVVGQGTDVP